MTAKRQTIGMIDIRAAVCANRGGYHGAPDNDIMAVWEMLTDAQRAEYLGDVAVTDPDQPSEGPEDDRTERAGDDTDQSATRPRKGRKRKAVD